MSNLSQTNSCAIVVHACDRYQLLFKGFEYFFKKNWLNIQDISLYFLTEELDLQSNLFKNIKTGKGEWTQRLRIGLEKINEPYVIYMQEDMWFNKPVNPHIISNIVKYASENKSMLIKLNSSGVYKTSPTDIDVDGLIISKLNNEESKYLMSHQISLWDKSFLLKQLRYNEHPWRNERKGTKRLKKLNPDIYQIDLFAENGNSSINNNISEVNRSEYQSVSVNAILNSNALPYIKCLIESGIENDGLIEYGQKLESNFVNQVTHDGLHKPRQNDFQKFMRKLRLT